MHKVNNILLASHGTVGARAAEQTVFDLCSSNTSITHLYVVPDLWRHMLADDWLNNQITQEQFGQYLESELQQEAEQNISRVHKTIENLDANYKYKLVFGDPEKCLLQASEEDDFNMVFTGSPRPRRVPGLRSRMIMNSFPSKLTSKHIQVPYPHLNN
ncbi:MAG: universal stress protein [Gammaproteobacteria bacterium]